MSDVTTQPVGKRNIKLDVLKVPKLNQTLTGFQNDSAKRSQSHLTHYSMGSIDTLFGDS